MGAPLSSQTYVATIGGAFCTVLKVVTVDSEGRYQPAGEPGLGDATIVDVEVVLPKKRGNDRNPTTTESF
jgi:hypothetical protein